MILKYNKYLFIFKTCQYIIFLKFIFNFNYLSEAHYSTTWVSNNKITNFGRCYKVTRPEASKFVLETITGDVILNINYYLNIFSNIPWPSMNTLFPGNTQKPAFELTFMSMYIL
jgi:hypothetical protein